MLGQFCLVNEVYQNLPRKTSEAELLPRYNQPLHPPDSNLIKDEQQALHRLKNDQNVVILPADIGRVTTVVLEQKCDKMDALVKDKQPYKELNATRPHLFNVNLTTKYLP